MLVSVITFLSIVLTVGVSGVKIFKALLLAEWVILA